MQAKHTASDRKAKRKPRVMRSKVQWQALIADFQHSSLTQQAFCEKNSITVSSFSKWRNQLETQSDQALFVDLGELPVASNTSESCMAVPDWQVELELGQGIFLRVRVL